MKAEIVTYTGKIFDILNPKPELVCIEDIAHALANICRYTGHTRQHYSVAEHSVRMAKSKELEGDPLKRLLHDSAEAYFGDIASPFKKMVYVPDPTIVCGGGFQPIYAVEDEILKAIGEALDVDLRHDDSDVKTGDWRMGITEVRDLMPASPAWDIWYDKFTPLKEIILPWTPIRAKIEFLSIYNDLTNKE